MLALHSNGSPANVATNWTSIVFHLGHDLDKILGNLRADSLRHGPRHDGIGQNKLGESSCCAEIRPLVKFWYWSATALARKRKISLFKIFVMARWLISWNLRFWRIARLIFMNCCNAAWLAFNLKRPMMSLLTTSLWNHCNFWAAIALVRLPWSNSLVEKKIPAWRYRSKSSLHLLRSLLWNDEVLGLGTLASAWRLTSWREMLGTLTWQPLWQMSIEHGFHLSKPSAPELGGCLKNWHHPGEDRKTLHQIEAERLSAEGLLLDLWLDFYCMSIH